MTAYTTSRGVQIGRCYIRPAMRVTGDAVVIQSVLLAKPQYTRPADKAVCWALFAGVIVVLWAIFFWSQP